MLSGLFITYNMSFWSSKTVLVTGGTGFIGSWLVKKLIDLGAEVLVLANRIHPQSVFATENLSSKVKYIEGLIENIEILTNIVQSNKIDIVYHLAAQSDLSSGKKNPYQTFEVNVRGTYNLLEAVKNYGKCVNGIIIASSESVYGNQESLPFSECAPLKAIDPYSVSKICSEYIGYSYYHTFGLPVVIVRKANIIGGGDIHFNHIVPYTIDNLLKNKKIILRSDGKFIRNYLYVKDVVDAYILLGENLSHKNVVGEIFNVSSDNRLETIELVRKIKCLMNKENIEIETLNIANDENKQQFSDSSKIERTIGWQPAYSLDEALRETIEWYMKISEFRL